MAKRITAIKAYAPKLQPSRTTQFDTIIDWIEGRTNLNGSEIRFVIRDLHHALLTFGRRGVPVKIDGLGTFTPTIRLDGRLRFNVLPDAELTQQLNDTFEGPILNRHNLGAPSEALLQQWNADHPDDPVV